MSNAPAAAKAKPGKDPALVHRKPLKTRLKENWQLYLLLLIPVIITIVYKYGLYIQSAFRVWPAALGAIWAGSFLQQPHDQPVPAVSVELPADILAGAAYWMSLWI